MIDLRSAPAVAAVTTLHAYDLQLMQLIVYIGGAVLYVLFGIAAGPTAARRLHRHAVRRQSAHALWLEPLGTTRWGKVVAVAVWPMLTAIIQIGFFVGTWDIFGKE